VPGGAQARPGGVCSAGQGGGCIAEGELPHHDTRTEQDTLSIVLTVLLGAMTIDTILGPDTTVIVSSAEACQCSWRYTQGPSSTMLRQQREKGGPQGA